MFLYADTETFSELSLKSCGLHKYAEPVEIMIMSYAFDDEPVTVLDLTAGQKIPRRVIDALEDPEITTVWHKSDFDRTVLRHGLDIELDTKYVHCTMVQALAHALPGGLDKLCEIFKIPLDLAKHKDGKRLIDLFCKPRPKNQKVRRATRETHPEDWNKFLAYAGNDIEAMRFVHKKVPTWNFVDFEKELWRLDQKINDRGFLVDVELAEKAIEAVDLAQKKLAKRTDDITFGDVQKATQRDRMLKHILQYYGVELPDMQKSTLERRLQDPDLPWAVKELIAIRLEASVTSTSKYRTLIRGVSSDGRLRGTLQFDGASRTRRWSGRLFQPQNLPRPTHKQKEIDSGIEAIKMGCADLITDNVMSLTSSCIRGCIIAPEGKKLCVSDLSNIEGRSAAWLAGEDWKIKAFSEYDDGTGHDLYVLAYSRSFGVKPESVDKEQRQLGKVQELALGYGGGVGAFVTFVMTYNMDLDKLAAGAIKSIPEDVMAEAKGSWDWHTKQRRSTLGLERNIWVVCDSLKRMWRRAHPQITSYWTDLENAARKAILNRGKYVQCRKVRLICEKNWLRIILPSGASLCYPSPRLEGMEISYMGMNQYTRKWSRIKTYGGKLFENICQSVARDVMAYNMPRIEDMGYEIVLTVHDEILTEAEDHPSWSHEHLSELLATNPSWAEGLPLAAGGFESKRYKKD